MLQSSKCASVRFCCNCFVVCRVVTIKCMMVSSGSHLEEGSMQELKLFSTSFWTAPSAMQHVQVKVRHCLLPAVH